MTMFCLIEAHILDVAEKFLSILADLSEQGKLTETFKGVNDRIRLLW